MGMEVSSLAAVSWLRQIEVADEISLVGAISIVRERTSYQTEAEARSSNAAAGDICSNDSVSYTHRLCP